MVGKVSSESRQPSQMLVKWYHHTESVMLGLSAGNGQLQCLHLMIQCKIKH